MRSLNPNLVTEKNKLDTTSSWLTLIQLEVSDTQTVYYVPNPASITFDGQTYDPFPCSIQPARSDSTGGLNEVQVIVSNVTREISGYLENNDLRGRKVKLIGINSAYLSDPTAKVFDEDYEITEINVTEKAVTFRLGHVRFLHQRFPSGRFLRDNCRAIFKSTECGYTGASTSCEKILEGSNGCRAHSNQARFGGFPAIPSVRR